MKREQFKITCNGKDVAIKSTWNASLRHVETTIRATARLDGCLYELVGSESNKDSKGRYHVSGSRTWQGKNGNTVVFLINKIIEA